MRKTSLFLAMLGKAMVIAVLAFGLVVMGCDTGSGGGSGSSNNSGIKKISQLSASASYDQTLAKVNEIIAATEHAPSGYGFEASNMQAKAYLVILVEDPQYKNWGNGGVGAGVISQINTVIDTYNQLVDIYNAAHS